MTCDPLQASSQASQSPSVVTSPIAYVTSVEIFAKSSRFRINIIRRKSEIFEIARTREVINYPVRVRNGLI